MPRLPGESGSRGEHAATELGLIGRGGEDLRAPRLHEGAPVRLLLIRDLDHVDHDLEAEEAARERECRAPLAGAGLGGQPLDAFLGVVVRLRHRGVGFVRSRRRCALVLVEDPRGGVERLLQTAGAIERAWGATACRCRGRDRGSRSSAPLETSCPMMAMGKIGVRSGGVSGSRVRGLRNAPSGSGTSARMLYQCDGSSSSVSKNFVVIAFHLCQSL